MNHPFWGTPIFGNTHMANTLNVQQSVDFMNCLEAVTLQGLTYPNWGKGKSSTQKRVFGGYVSEGIQTEKHEGLLK